MAEPVLLTSAQMANFVARGFLRFDAAVPDDDQPAVSRRGGTAAATGRKRPAKAYAKLLSASGIPAVPAGTPLVAGLPQTVRDHARAGAAGGAGRDRQSGRAESDLRSSLPARDVSAGVLRSARAAERFAAHAPGFDDRSAPRVRRSDHVLPARRDARDGRHALRARHAPARGQRSGGRALPEHPRPAARGLSCGHAAVSASRHLARRRRQSLRPFALHVQDPHQSRRCGNSGCGIRRICRTTTISSGRSS